MVLTGSSPGGLPGCKSRAGLRGLLPPSCSLSLHIWQTCPRIWWEMGSSYVKAISLSQALSRLSVYGVISAGCLGVLLSGCLLSCCFGWLPRALGIALPDFWSASCLLPVRSWSSCPLPGWEDLLKDNFLSRVHCLLHRRRVYPGEARASACEGVGNKVGREWGMHKRKPERNGLCIFGACM